MLHFPIKTLSKTLSGFIPHRLLLWTLIVVMGTSSTFLPLSSPTPAYAARVVSPAIDPQNGFPVSYTDDAGNEVMLCIDGSDPKCVLPVPGEDPNFDPTQPTAFPNKCPME